MIAYIIYNKEFTANNFFMMIPFAPVKDAKPKFWDAAVEANF